MQSSFKEEAREIGFNDEVRVGNGTLHVQTEVLVREAVEVRTIVLRGGNVLRAFRRTCAEGIAIQELRETAEQQHRQALAEAAGLDSSLT